ncbi:MAG: 7TM diverse intracellular signaling domain-containing protein [Ramlibacter sp.]
MLPRWLGMLLLAGFWLPGPALPANVPSASASASTITLTPGSEAVSLDHLPRLLGPRGSATLPQLAAGRLDRRMEPPEGAVTALSGDSELWIPIRLHNRSQQPAAWQLQVAQPSIDEVTLFEARADRWIESTAGDRVARSAWPRAGRFPAFDLRLEPGETRAMFLRVRSAIPTPVPVRLLDPVVADALDQQADISFGFVLGSLALLVGACLVQVAVYRDVAYFLYGSYALLLGLAFASISGFAGRLLWGDYPAWGDASKAVFPLAAAGVSVWLVRALCRVSTRERALARVSAVLGTLVLGLALAFALMRSYTPWLMALGMFTAATTVLVIALVTWKRGDAMGGWVFAAHVPLIAVTVMVVLRMFGIAPFEFDPAVLTSGAIGAILPLLLAALHLRSKELLAVQVRAREFRSIDALTGLLTPPLFSDRVHAAVRRYNRSRHNAVVMYIRVANYALIREVHGGAVVERSMTRAAMKLQRLMPDADCIGRVSESTMGLIFETITAREALTQRAARLFAHGLMPLEESGPAVTLRFLVVGGVLSENPLEAPALEAALEKALASMTVRTRRPIRFLEQGAGALGPVEGEPEEEGEADTQPA